VVNTDKTIGSSLSASRWIHSCWVEINDDIETRNNGDRYIVEDWSHNVIKIFIDTVHIVIIEIGDGECLESLDKLSVFHEEYSILGIVNPTWDLSNIGGSPMSCVVITPIAIESVKSPRVSDIVKSVCDCT
jgi:hypothetical protein